MSPIVNANWLQDNIDRSDLIILDVRQESNKSNLKADASNRCIPGARAIDLKKDFSNQESIYPNTIPSPSQFEQSCSRLGIKNSDTIVVYDNIGIYLSPRMWWLFKIMGHESVYVLDGGLPEWKRKEFQTEEIKQQSFSLTDYKSSYKDILYRSFEDVEGNIISEQEQIIDARSSDRFHSRVPEPREGLRGGHIPKSENIPFKEVLIDGKFKSKEELEEVFSRLNNQNSPYIFSCGSGITACILYLAHDIISSDPKSIYDGSWTEWAMRKPE